MGFTLTDVLLFGSATEDIDSDALVILRNQVLQFGATNRAIEVVVSGIPPLSLKGAVEDSLSSVKAYGGLLQSGVPSGYTAVEYVERPSGNTEQYIETNWKPNLAKNIRVQGIATYMGSVTDYRPILLGNYTGNRTSTLNIEFDGRTDKNLRIYTLKANAGTGGDLQVGPFATNDVVDFDIQITGSNGALAVSATAGGTTITGSGTIENVGEQTLYNMMLFKDHRATTTSASKVSSRIHYLKATEDDKVVFELIPAVRNSDNAVGFYDKVSGQFLTNQGTGFLTAGNAITPTPSDPVDLVCNNGALKILDKSDWTIFTNPTSIAGQGVFINSTGKWQAVGDRGAGCAIPLTIGKQYTLVIHKKTISLGQMLRYGQSPQVTPTSAGVQLTDWYRGGIADGQMVSFVAKQPYFVMQLGADPTEAGMIQEAIEVLEAQGSDYTFLKYIETTGTQYIQTSISGPARWVGAGQGTSEGTGSQCILSCLLLNESLERNANYFVGSRVVNAKYWAINTNVGGNMGVSTVPTLNYAEYDIIFTNNKQSYGVINNDNVFYKYTGSSSWTYNEWYIGVGFGANNTEYYFTGNIYRQKAYQNNVLVGDFIPAIRNSDNVVGMYDAVSGTFFENQGTGTFTAGPVIVDGEVLNLTPSNDTAGVANLFKIDNYVDTQEILTGLITHKLGIFVLNGLETYNIPYSFYIHTDSCDAYITLDNAQSVQTQNSVGICTQLKLTNKDIWSLTEGYQNTFTFNGKQLHLNFAHDVIGTTSSSSISDALTAIKSYIAAQYAAGTPVILVYPLATAQDEVAPIPQTMQVVAGDNLLDIVQAGMSGLEVSATYMKGVSVTITEIEDANIGNSVEVVIA